MRQVVDMAGAMDGSALAKLGPEEFLWQGFPLNTVGILAAGSGRSKSFRALQMGVAVSCSDPAADLMNLRPLKHGRVVYYVCEDSMRIVLNRLDSIAKLLSKESKREMTANFSIQILNGENFDLLVDSEASRLEQETKGCCFVLLDTLNDFHRGDTKLGRDMLQLVKNTHRIACNNEQVILFPHHLNKQGIQDAEEALSANLVSVTGAAEITNKARYVEIMLGMTKHQATLYRDAVTRQRIPDRDIKRYVCVHTPKTTGSAEIEPVWMRKNNDGIQLPAQLRLVSDTDPQVDGVIETAVVHDTDSTPANDAAPGAVKKSKRVRQND